MAEFFVAWDDNGVQIDDFLDFESVTIQAGLIGCHSYAYFYAIPVGSVFTDVEDIFNIAGFYYDAGENTFWYEYFDGDDRNSSTEGCISMYVSTSDFTSDAIAFKVTFYDPCTDLARFRTFETGLVPEQKIFQDISSGIQNIQIFDNDANGFKTVRYSFIDSETIIEI